jgi:hypothetical protein
MKWMIKPLIGIGILSTTTFMFSCQHGFCDKIDSIPGSSGFICENKFSTCQKPKFVCKTVHGCTYNESC